MNLKNIIIVIICIFLVGLYVLQPRENLEPISDSDNIQKLGFIITRHVNSESTNQLWIMCIQRIRNFYPTVPIVIIDDNSNYEFVKMPEDNPNILDNCIVIQSEYKGRGELLPYYYFYKNHWFEKAIYIHDSVFINGPIKDVDNIQNIKFMWEFRSDQIWDERPYIEEFLGYLNYGPELLDILKKETKWIGSHGVMSVITYDYVKHLMEKYNLMLLLDHVVDRTRRKGLERAFAIVCFHDLGSTSSIYGHYDVVHEKFPNIPAYVDALQQNQIGPDPVKLYSSR